MKSVYIYIYMKLVSQKFSFKKDKILFNGLLKLPAVVIDLFIMY